MVSDGHPCHPPPALGDARRHVNLSTCPKRTRCSIALIVTTATHTLANGGLAVCRLRAAIPSRRRHSFVVVRQRQHRIAEGRSGAILDVLEGARGAARQGREDGAHLRARQRHPRDAQAPGQHSQPYSQAGEWSRRLCLKCHRRWSVRVVAYFGDQVVWLKSVS